MKRLWGLFSLARYLERWGITRAQIVVASVFFLLILAGRIVLWQKQMQHVAWNDRDWQRQNHLLRRKVAEIDSLWQVSHLQKGSDHSLSEKPSFELINLNSASKEQLMAIPGVGPTLAERIIEWRELNGSFTKAEDLQKIKGIGKKKFEKIVPFITLRK